ncbi:MAG: alpha/beta fold hydrolase [Dehalococcoidia bacterium]
MATNYPVRDIFVEANGIRHHLVARGAPGSPVVMMLHGLAGQARVFDSIANHLAAKYHVYCLDVRGRGESAWGPPEGYAIDTYVEDLEAVRDALGLQRMSLVGTSMGGLITMEYAPKHPEHVAKAVLNDVGPEVDPKGLERILSYVGGAPEMFADMKAVIRYYKEHYAPMVEHMPDDQISEFARHNVRRSDTGVHVWKMDPAVRTTVAAPPAVTPWDALKGMKCPTLILRGANSDVLSADIAKRMLEALPGAQLVEVPGVGHAPVLSEPVAVKALDEFLA